MKTIKRMSSKIVYTVLCFSLIVSMYSSLGVIKSGATLPTVDPLPIEAYVALDIDCIGEKLKLSEVSEIEVRLSVRNETNESIEIYFAAGFPHESSDLHLTAYSNRALLYVACLEDKEIEAKKSWTSGEILPGAFDNAVLRIYSNNGDGDFKDYTDPQGVDAFGEKAKVITYKVNMSDMPELDGKLKIGMITSEVYTEYEAESYEDQGYGEHNIYFFTDGKHIAFSYDSPELAQRLVLGDFGYFWKIAVPDFFNGIGNFFRFTIPEFFYSVRMFFKYGPGNYGYD